MHFSTSLICCDMSDVANDVSAILSCGDERFTYFHADFMDGHFVPRLGISPELVQSLRRKFGGLVTIDSHMMVDDPYEYADVVAPYSDYYMFHAEAVKDPMRTVQKIRKNWANVKVGLYFNLSTSFECYIDIINEVDAIGFMGISPGVLGTSSYAGIVVRKLELLRNYCHMIRGKDVFIDGSVKFDTIKKYSEYKPRAVVCGSSTIFKDVGTDEDRTAKILGNIEKMRKTVQ